MEEVETRELRYFVALAEELHFGRAAQRLGIAQPPLSRAIRQLERRLGVALVERTSRAARLTAAGEVLLHEGRAALDAVAAATRRAQRAGSAGPRLILAMKPAVDAGLLPQILTEYNSQPGAVPVEIAFSIGQRAAMLRDGRADVGLLHSPQNDLAGLDAEELLTERQVVVLPEHHRLAQRPSVRLADLDGEKLPRWPEASQDNGQGPVVQDIGQLMQLITLGRVAAVVPESIRRQLHAGLVCRPVADAPATTLVIAWPQNSTSLHVAAFVRAASTAARQQLQRARAQPAPGPDEGGDGRADEERNGQLRGQLAPHRPVGAALEQRQRQEEVDRDASGKQTHPLLPGAGLGEYRVHQVEVHDLGQFAQVPGGMDPRCRPWDGCDGRLLLQRDPR